MIVKTFTYYITERHGYVETTRAYLRKLKISKKTLYLYVKSKEDLIEKLFYYDEMIILAFLNPNAVQGTNQFRCRLPPFSMPMASNAAPKLLPSMNHWHLQQMTRIRPAQG